MTMMYLQQLSRGLSVIATPLRALAPAALVVAVLGCTCVGTVALAQAVTATPPAQAASAAADAAAAPAAPATAPPRAASSAPTPALRNTTALFKNDVYGVEVMGAHLSGSGYVVDVRYRVLDATKAQPMLDRKVRPVLINETNGERFYVPQPPIVGALRQTARNNNIVVGKIYFMLFANPDKRIKNGDKLTMMVGDQKFGVLEVGK